MFSFLQFVASPLVGGLSDVYGRKPVMLLCLVSTCIPLVDLFNFIYPYLLVNVVFFSCVSLFFFLLKQVGIASSYVLWALSKNFALFVLARMVGGISKGNVSLSMAVIADVSSVATRGRGMVSCPVFASHFIQNL
jgi:MFS family permease